ncbi:Cyclin-dependent kinase 14 [Goodea atripinnis]|uniref:Cyclin-dependent kinase 14 n=1 Tax=Goodea atripinnis TaxID=208336 RepID=A0ABV0N4X5_9TELE
MSTRGCQGTDSVIKPLDTIPEDKKVRVQRTQSGFDPFEKPTSQVKRVHSENNACINAKSSSSGKESPKLRRHSSPSSCNSFFVHTNLAMQAGSMGTGDFCFLKMTT